MAFNARINCNAYLQSTMMKTKHWMWNPHCGWIENRTESKTIRMWLLISSVSRLTYPTQSGTSIVWFVVQHVIDTLHMEEQHHHTVTNLGAYAS